MTHHTTPLISAAVIGASASVIQSTGAPSVSMLVPIVSAVVGGAVSYGIMKGAVQGMERDVTQMRRDMAQMYDLLRDFSAKIGRIEGRLEDR